MQSLFLEKALHLPIKEKKEISILHRVALLIEHGGSFLIKKPAEKALFQDLYELPSFDRGKNSLPKELFLFLDSLSLFSLSCEKLKEESHTFTRFRAHLYPFYVKFMEKRNSSPPLGGKRSL